MSKIEKLTEEQLNEIRELAKTKPLKSIAGHFKMNVLNFRILREEQPEIDIIYKAIPTEQKCKAYTAEEILEVERLAETLSISSIVKHFKVSLRNFVRSRKNQPKLNEALMRGTKNRAGRLDKEIEDGKKASKSGAKITVIENLSTRAPDDILPEEALNRFYRLKAEEKRMRQLRELKNMN
jgi:hypothetical protein